MQWLQHFPEIDALDDSLLRQELMQQKIVTVKQGSYLFHEGDACQHYVLVVSGSVRVCKTDSEGREILLYRVGEGQTCMLTTTCLLGVQNYPAEGIAETDVELISLSMQVFERLLVDSADFRHYVMAHIGERICDMLLLIEDVAFGRMDQRLAKLLLKRFKLEGKQLKCTHQELASELGTAREVVSRMLKSFENQGLVRLGRGEVYLQKISTLEKISIV